jgi:hypothetical protein
MKETMISCLDQPQVDYKPIFDEMARYLARFDEYSGVNRDIEVWKSTTVCLGVGVGRRSRRWCGAGMVDLITTVDNISTGVYLDN